MESRFFSPHHHDTAGRLDVCRTAACTIGLLLIVLTACGCGTSETPSDEHGKAVSHPSSPKGIEAGSATAERSDGRTAEAETKERSTEPNHGTGATSAADAVPKSASDAVRVVARGLAEGRLESLWRFLPPSYQADLNELVHAAAARIDPELWRRSFATLSRLVRLMQQRREMFLEAFPADESHRDRLRTEWDALAGVLEVLAESDLADPDYVRTMDLGVFLAGPAGEALARLRSASQAEGDDPFELWRHLEVSVVRTDKTGQVLRFELPGGRRFEQEFVQVEGRWIPRTWADSWETTIAGLQRRLDATDAITQRRSWLTALEAIDDVLDRLESAASAEQFRAELQSLAGSLALLDMMIRREVGTGDLPTAGLGDAFLPESAITVVVTGSLSPEDRKWLRLRLQALADPGGFRRAEWQTIRGVAVIVVRPVENVEEFARRLDFLRIDRVDTEQRRIRAHAEKPIPPLKETEIVVE